MEQTKAFIFDLNGTMINDMEFHTKAWYQIINDELGKAMSWNEVKTHMYGKNAEVLARIFGADHFTPAEIDKIAEGKEARYREEFRPHLQLLPGLDEFLHQASEQGILLAIGSAAIPENINFVLDSLNIRNLFDAIVSADEVQVSKPDPETFTRAAGLLGVPPSSCIVFEDAPKGVEAGLNAHMQCIVITSAHSKEDFDKYPNVLAAIENYNDPFCKQLLQQEVTAGRP